VALAARTAARGLGASALALVPAALAQWLGPQWLATPLKAVVAAGIGVALASLLETPAQLLAIAGIAVVVDAVSVAAGPTRAALDDAPGLVEATAAHLPAWGGGETILVGAVDLLFLAAFVAGARRTGLRTGASAVAVTCGLIAGAALTAGLDRALPALPLMAAGLVAANAGRFRRNVGA
jgi:hypothetical protein